MPIRTGNILNVQNEHRTKIVVTDKDMDKQVKGMLEMARPPPCKILSLLDEVDIKSSLLTVRSLVGPSSHD